MALRNRDLESVLSFIADAHDADGPEALTTGLLDRLTELFACQYATYERFDWQRRAVTAYVTCSNEHPCAPLDTPPSFWREDQRPRWRPALAAFHKLSDSFDRRERERFRDEEEFNAEFRIVDTLGFWVGEHRGRCATLHFDSPGRDFGERDRELALELRPHVEALWRRAGAQRQVTELVAQLERTDDRLAPRALVLLGPDRQGVDHTTAEARALLEAWFAKARGRLPDELREWVTLAAPGDRYTKRRNGSTLTVEAAGDFALTLNEHASAAAAVTPREREVLALVSEGLTNAEIAQRLWVAPSTVAKHLEQAYAKLGVHTRTAAVARLAVATH